MTSQQYERLLCEIRNSGTSRPGLYLMVFIIMMEVCSGAPQ